jgi:superfamily II DNA or RNA helicase
LDQSQRIFQHVLRDPIFGERWTGGRRPELFEHVFASIQSLNAADLENLAPDHFDVVIVDEFHHAAAPSYEAILKFLKPRELLGLTATPERSDGLSILPWFDGRIAAELRLWDAIDQNYLSPFFYYGVHDGLKLQDVPWRRGAGYEVEALTNVLTGSSVWAEFVVKQFVEKTQGTEGVRALGFCVSVRHAEYMASVFNVAGIPAIAVSAKTPATDRVNSLLALDRGEVRVVFSVDLFNEGVDVPSVDALLMLRPTESGTLFLQQLGRGLRKKEGKTACVVLDFVGHHRKEFRFDRRFRSLFGGTRKEIQQQIENGFPYLPAGCHMELDRVSSEIVLASFRSAIPSLWNEKINELRNFVASGHPLSLNLFLEHSGLDLEDVYSGGRTWMRLCADAGLMTPREGAVEAVLARAISRLLHIDDLERIQVYEEILGASGPPQISSFPERRKRLVRMLLAQLMDGVPRDFLPDNSDMDAALVLLWGHPRILSDLCGLLAVLRRRISHLHGEISMHGTTPIRVHASYSRIEILAALGAGEGWRTVTWREGVKWFPDAKADVFVITFDKTSGGFSPTTRYKDYAISRELIHWESQSTTRSETETGQRYQHHKARGSDVILFARLSDESRSFWCLGSAEYVRHEGDLPMSVVWKLKTPLPGDLFAQFAAAVA